MPHGLQLNSSEAPQTPEGLRGKPAALLRSQSLSSSLLTKLRQSPLLQILQFQTKLHHFLHSPTQAACLWLWYPLQIPASIPSTLPAPAGVRVPPRPLVLILLLKCLDFFFITTATVRCSEMSVVSQTPSANPCPRSLLDGNSLMNKKEIGFINRPREHPRKIW